VKFLLNLLAGKKKSDFDWNAYHFHYEGELKDIEKEYTLILKNEDYVSKEGRILFKNKKTKPFLYHHRILLETISKLSPSSVLEVGCGWGDHLYNLSVLCPNLQLFGIDISKKQIENLKKRHPTLNARFDVVDITQSDIQIPECDLVFTNAVIMHIKEKTQYLTALTNLFKIAKRQIVLKENWKSHNFLKDIMNLHSNNTIPWNEIFYYYNESDEKERPGVMIISTAKLDFPNLSNYSFLLNHQL